MTYFACCTHPHDHGDGTDASMETWLNLPDIFDVTKTAFLDLYHAIVTNSSDATRFRFTLRAIELASVFIFQQHFITDMTCVLGMLAIFMCIVFIDVLLLVHAECSPNQQ